MEAFRGRRIVNGKAQELRVADANLEDLVEGAATTVYGEARRKRQRLVINIDAEAAQVRADPAKLKRVLADLLRDAVRRTPVAGKVSVEARRERFECVIAVSDGGEGFPPGEAPRLFERSATVKGLVDQHGGRVWTESRPGRGATVVVSLPQPASRAAPETRDISPTGHLRASHG